MSNRKSFWKVNKMLLFHVNLYNHLDSCHYKDKSNEDQWLVFEKSINIPEATFYNLCLNIYWLIELVKYYYNADT